MRVAGGIWRGREVLMPKSEAVRPTQSRVREAVFDLLMQVVPGRRFLDLFAGSGAMGIEALSRGAAAAAFWERDRRVFATLQKNLAAFGIAPEAARNLDSLAALGLPTEAEPPAPKAPRTRRSATPPPAARPLGEAPYSVVFADPPYRWARENGMATLAGALRERGVLANGGFLVAEMDRDTPAEEMPGFTLVRDRLYGTTRIAVWRAQEEA